MVTSFLRQLWREGVVPLLKRPPAEQVAALCYRMADDHLEVLLVTSSEGRWILPKGWPIDGLHHHQAALTEAWEEAGVKTGIADSEVFGTYASMKTMKNGVVQECLTMVYPVRVMELAKTYPEQDKRDRIWVPFENAAQMVREPDLAAILRRFPASHARDGQATG